MTLLKVKQGHYETAILIILIQFVLRLLCLQVFRSVTVKYLHDSNVVYGDAAV